MTREELEQKAWRVINPDYKSTRADGTRVANRLGDHGTESCPLSLFPETELERYANLDQKRRTP